MPIMVTDRADIGGVDQDGRVVAHPAVVLACDVTGCDRVLAVTGESAADYRSARAYARSVGWVVHPFEHDWCPEHGFSHGGAGLPLPYEEYRGAQD